MKQKSDRNGLTSARSGDFFTGGVIGKKGMKNSLSSNKKKETRKPVGWGE